MENYLLFRTALEPLNKRVLEIEQSIYPRRLIEAGEEKKGFMEHLSLNFEISISLNGNKENLLLK